MRSARDNNHNNTTQPAREIAGSLGCDAMQPPRRVSVDVSAAARFALLYFFLPLEASAHTYLQRLPACVLGGRSALICRRADPPGYQTPAQKKVRLSPPSQLAAVPARPLAGGFFSLEQPARARGLFTAAVQKPGPVPYSYTTNYQARRVRVHFPTVSCAFTR